MRRIRLRQLLRRLLAAAEKATTLQYICRMCKYRPVELERRIEKALNSFDETGRLRSSDIQLPIICGPLETDTQKVGTICMFVPASGGKLPRKKASYRFLTVLNTSLPFFPCPPPPPFQHLHVVEKASALQKERCQFLQGRATFLVGVVYRLQIGNWTGLATATVNPNP